jgi:glycosyltransferase involved in cell wall biosynthesis
MRVALDAAPLRLKSGGLRRYTEELSRALAVEFPGDQFVLACDRGFSMPPDAPPNLTAVPPPSTALERRWWSLGLNRALARQHVDVFHGTNFEVPYWPARPSILSLHDLSPWREDTRDQTSHRVRVRVPWLIRLRIGTLVSVPTEAVRREAIARFRVDPARVVVIPYAAAAVLRPLETSSAVPYFLCAGSAGRRKNVETIVEAWREVRKRHAVDLILTGEAGNRFSGDGLRVVGVVEDGRLAELYSGALALLYPSLYEGFGLPLVEAMQCRCAVIASCDAAVTEVCGGAALQLDARDTRAWAEAMSSIVEHPEMLAGLRARSVMRAREFCWRRTARLTREAYEEARRRFGS